MENNIELGSEFNLSLNGLKKVKDNLFSYLKNYKVQWFDYGRSALRHIPIPNDKKVLLPEFICESVINCFDKKNIQFYHIDAQFNIDIDDLLQKIDETMCRGIIYVPYYFGFLQKESSLKKIKELAESYDTVVIEDTTQSFFSTHNLYGDYALASIRKWMAIPMGGVLYTSQSRILPSQNICRQNNDNTRAYGMILKDMFLKSSYDTNAKYRELFAASEKAVDNLTDSETISDFSYFLISCIDVNTLIDRRKKNSFRLANGLKKLGIDSIRLFDEKECPLVYPLRVKNRDVFRHYLMENRIYCAVHWPFEDVISEERINAKYNSETLISLPIDQRYGDTEIDYMIDVIQKYGGDLSF